MTLVALILGLATLALAGLIAGLFYAFSVAVMPGLDQAGGRAAIPVMQRINEAILNPLFFASFFLTSATAFAAAWLLRSLGAPDAALCFALVGAVQLLGSIVPTMIVNVPMNQRLAAATVTADDSEAQRVWLAYSKPWTRWNHVRTIACLASLLLAGAGLYLWDR